MTTDRIRFQKNRDGPGGHACPDQENDSKEDLDHKDCGGVYRS